MEKRHLWLAIGMIIDGILDTNESEDWLFLRWIDPGKCKKRFVRAFRSAEKLVKDSGLRGWYCASEKEHTDMHKLIQRVGAVPYATVGNEILFKKES